MGNDLTTNPEPGSQISRRKFLGTALGACLFPTIIPSSALGYDGAVAPSNRITAGFIGLGMKGIDNLWMFISRPDVQVVALCDVDEKRLQSGLEVIRKEYESEDCILTADYRDITRRPDVDVVVISTPDHWHVLPPWTPPAMERTAMSRSPLR